MESLPIEVLTHILQYLSPIDRLRSEQVCRKWRDASRYTWRDVQALYIMTSDSDNRHYKIKKMSKSNKLVEKKGNCLFLSSFYSKIIGCLLSRSRHSIKKLNFEYWNSKYYAATIFVLINYCRNLEILEIGQIDENDNMELLSMLLEQNKQLHSFKCHEPKNFIGLLPLKDWRSLRLKSWNMADEEKIISLIEHSENLEEFEVKQFTRRILDVLLTRCKLKNLYFDTIHGASLEMIFDITLLNRLTTLHVSTFTYDSNLLCNMLQYCCQLKWLGIADPLINITAILLETIASLPALETLELCTSFIPIQDDMLIHLTKVKNLWLSVRGDLTNNGILQLIKKSEILEKLNIEYTDVTPEMFKQLVGEMSDRPKYLEVMVPDEIFDEISGICAGSKIRVVKDMQCFRRWND